jgi:hypothetical protein
VRHGSGRMFLDLFGIEGVRFASFDRDGILGTMAEASSQAVTIDVADEPGFAVDDGDGLFGAGRYTQAAAVAFVRVDVHDVTSVWHGVWLLKG